MKRWNALVIGVVALMVVAAALVSREPSAPSTFEKMAESVPSALTTERRAPVLVELFTSEGCSSCPPADALLIKLEKTEPIAGAEVIALSQHVDYWNRLGWVDPYSAAEFSTRQGNYSSAFGRDGVYTPQMIVDGQSEFVGSNESRARQAIAAAARSPKATITLTRNEAATSAEAGSIPLEVRIERLPPVASGDTAEVLLAVTESGLRSNVSSGENSGRRLMHTAVVRQFSVIGVANAGSEAAFSASPVLKTLQEWKRANLRAVVFVQERQSRKVLGAASISLAP